MKFARYMSCLERDAPPQWQGKFVKYKQLKKMLKRCRPADQPEAPLDKEQEDAFFTELQTQLASINHNFQIEADRTVAAYHRSTVGLRLLFCVIPLKCFSGPRQYAALADRAYWCRKYARSNAVALRKILKKHDKVCGNDRGREFLQQCWCSASAEGIGLFLHSPLLDELKAVQDVLHYRIAELEKHDEDELVNNKESKAAAASAGGGQVGMAVPNKVVAAPAGGSSPPATTSKTNGTADSAPSPIITATAAATALARPSLQSSVPVPRSASDGDKDNHHVQLNRLSLSTVSQSSDGLGGAVAHGGPASVSGSIGSTTAPSLRAQRSAALAAIEESPTCMLDSSDIEWEQDDSPRIQSNNYSNAWIGGSHSSGEAATASQIPEAGDAAITTQQTTGADTSQITDCPEVQQRFFNATSAACNNSTTITSGPAFDGIDPDAPTPRLDIEGEVNPRAPGSNKTQSFPDGGGSSGIGLVLGPFRDDELRCPICLDLMYKPVGLGCGHKFCRPCALEAAGFGKAFGAFNNIASYIPARTPCPHCRQTNVYKNAVMLKEVGSLIRSRYPEQWAERRAEDRQRRREISVHKNRLARERVSSMLGTTPFDLLNP